MKLVRVYAAVVAFCLLVGSADLAEGDLSPDLFSNLRAELILRRDNEFSGTLDKAAKKRLKAVTRSLAYMEQRTGSILVDLKIARKIGVKLDKAYPLVPGPSDEHDIYSLVYDVFFDHLAKVESNLRNLELRQAFFTPKTHEKVRKQIKKASKKLFWLRSFGDDWKRVFPRLARVQKAIEKGGSLADRDPAPGTGRTGVRAHLSTLPFEASTVSSTYNRVTAGLRIEGTVDKKSVHRGTLTLVLHGLFSTGPFALDERSFEGSYLSDGVPFKLLSKDGSVTVTRFDLDAARVAGIFEFLTLDGFGFPGAEVLNGEFNFDNVVVTGN